MHIYGSFQRNGDSPITFTFHQLGESRVKSVKDQIDRCVIVSFSCHIECEHCFFINISI